MDFLSARRTGATYGKSNKRPLVHDLFDYRSSSDPLSAPKVDKERAESVDDKIFDTTSSPNEPGTSTEAVALSRYSSRPATTSSRLDPPPPPPPKTANEFDLTSSEDESGQGSGVDNDKRRRVAAPLRSRDVNKNATVQGNMPRRQRNVKSAAASNTVVEKQAYRQLQVRHRANREPQPAAQDGVRLRIQQSAAALMQDHASGTEQSKGDDGQPATVVDVTIAESSDHLTDHSTQSRSRTPKRKRPLSQYSEESVPSPSGIAFNSLRLTPERGILVKRAISLTSTSDEDETPRKVRSRLIDRLDAPSHRPESPDSVDNMLVSPAKPFINSHASELESRPPMHDIQGGNPTRVSTTQRGQQPQVRSRATYGTKARTTYAKERSHLSDMTEEVGLLKGMTTSHSSHNLSSQHATTALAMQLELENDDSDEPNGPSRLKSIHELRKAGANNRFDREVMGLLEDIEAADTSSKSLRLQALMKLARRVADPAFLHYIIDTGRWIRIAQAASAAPDALSTVLSAAVFLRLSNAAQASTASDFFKIAGDLALPLLTNESTMQKTARERRSNLSKSLIRDISDFEDYLTLQLKHNNDFEGETISINELAILLLHQTLRKCLDLAVVVEKIPAQCFSGILTVLIQHAQKLPAIEYLGSSFKIIQKALQLLEACSIAFDEEEMNIPAAQIASLGQALAYVMEHARQNDEEGNIHVLRAVVSLSNNKPRTCHLLGNTEIIHAIFVTVDDHFRSVATQADLEQKLDSTKLDLVILALGCLLNFAESDGEFRIQFSSGRRDKYHYVESLVGIFSSQLSKVQDAITQEQSQVLVAVGYLSMVLCALSLDATVRQQITHLLKDKTFEELCDAAETFLQHLRTVEGLASEDGTVSVFTARFTAILEAIRDTSS